MNSKRGSAAGSTDAPFAPKWPEGLQQGEAYRVLCDDKGRNGGSWLQVYTSTDGDMRVAMQDWEEMPEGQPSPLPGFRCRTFDGGGQNHRTHQALLWLAQAIRLDNEERLAKYGKLSRALTPHEGASPNTTEASPSQLAPCASPEPQHTDVIVSPDTTQPGSGQGEGQ
jgi:hypothetical protein